MKKKKLIFSAILTIATLAACNKDFLDTRPTNAVPEDQVLNSVDNAETIINGTWSYMFEEFFTYATPGYKSIHLTSDAMGSDVAVTTAYGLRNAYTFVEMTDQTQTRVRGFWTILYKVIDNSNILINKLDNVPGDDAKRRYLKGQAYVLRANSYITLASFYQQAADRNAKTVPIYTEPSGTETQGKPKSTLAQVYQQAIDDLTKALPLLKDYTRDQTKKWKIDLNVAEGLLARAYLYNRQFNEAIPHAAAARQGYPLMPADDYLKGFNDINNPEWIWGHGQTPNQSNASYNFNYLDVSSPVSYYKSFMADPYFKDLFDNNDVRTRLFDWDTLPDEEGYLRYKKFRFRDPGAMVGDLVLMRAAEMYLIEAEAYARTGNSAKATEALNALRSARNATPYNGAGGQTLIDAIMIERRKELWGEGFALSDIIRTGASVIRRSFVSYNGNDSIIRVPRPDGTFKEVAARGHRTLALPDGSEFKPNSPYYLFAIPIAEVQNNPNLNN
ncbi:MAG TPA: RagB/SusD family nutrient uptake outer membrane protein [Chitinophaga sp.]|uniref:RagB/SusD family nutrient uptake outer membrane protein n=1 Tax=Chitinophaga sp. TaxID=1869181 RepID=UPI002CC4C8D7|nr:RagB/SusD family nutrient uptake outer membrane protein [Chitinophaga sp.]HVI44952.1 RagB/SusD family nutrient uptake outer membrane protein [Chitinophaga sp.]